MHRSMYLIILLVSVVLAGLVQWNAQVNLNRELSSYLIESQHDSDQIANNIKTIFDTTYRATRTIARLPAVQSIQWDQVNGTMDRNGTVLDENTRLTVQEIYNALAIDVAVSELYIVPANIDPDGFDPSHQSPREPITTFDEFIVGRTSHDAQDGSHKHGKSEIEEVEIFEYRLMRKQLDWMQTKYPTSDKILALEYPQISGSPVITCDNSRLNPDSPEDADRSGIVLSVPIFDPDGALRGCVSAIILTDALADVLVSGEYAVHNSTYAYTVAPETLGQWNISNRAGFGTKPDSSLLYSKVTPIATADQGGQWTLWSGFPDTEYWSRNDVNATLQARAIGFGAVLILALGAVAATALVLGAHKRLADANAGLEETVGRRTLAMTRSRDSAILSLDRERIAMAEKNKALIVLEQMATTDKLTGLPNRTKFLDRLHQMMNRSRRDGCKFAVLFFDFDRFKVVNDSLGHEAGDALLCNIASIFRRELRDSDTAARFGGDEFVVLLGDLCEWSDAVRSAERLLEASAHPHFINGSMIVSTASIGLVTNQLQYQNPSDMIRDADAAMYQAKENGKNRVVEFDKEMHANSLDQLKIETDLRNMIMDDDFRLVYQPIIDLATGRIKGLEALIRWEHPTRGLVSPGDFIPIAEDTGLICQIGKWVLWTAAAQMAEWNDALGLSPKLSINVNVSKRQIMDPSFLDDILACQRAYKLFDGELQLEITESLVVDQRSNIIPLLKEIRSHNIHIVMDDFGTGVSSLSTLHAFPIDVLKIDQSFIRAMSGDRSLLAVVSSITNLAENLGIRTVAEGIESADVVAALQSIGSTWGQGYYFAKPLAPDSAKEFIQDNIHQKDAAA